MPFKNLRIFERSKKSEAVINPVMFVRDKIDSDDKNKQELHTTCPHVINCICLWLYFKCRTIDV